MAPTKSNTGIIEYQRLGKRWINLVSSKMCAVSTTLLFFILVLFLTNLAQADERLERFVSQFATFNRHNPTGEQWQGPASPWAPYLKRQFTEGLNEKERQQYLRAQEIPTCSKVSQLDKRGFLRLYPFLAPAFTHIEIAANFGSYISMPLSRGFRRCVNLRALRIFVQISKRENRSFATLDVAALVKAGQPRGWSGLRDMYDPEGRRNSAVEAEVFLAVCREYGPAIKDVFMFIDKLQFLNLPVDLEFYLFVLARHLGIDHPVITRRIQRARYFLSDGRRDRIRAAVMYGAILPAKISGWNCVGPRAKTDM